MVAAFTCVTAGALALGAGCGQANPGFNPPAGALAFPSGLLLDPRVSAESNGPCGVDPAMPDEPPVECAAGDVCTSNLQCRTPASWLVVTNANSDRRYNAGSLVALNLDLFWDAVASDQVLPQATDIDEAYDAAASGLKYAGSADPEYQPGKFVPCRRVANLPQVIECLEEPFVLEAATVQFGNFPGPTVAWDMRTDTFSPAADQSMLLTPVRGDPSITYVEMSGGLGGADDLQLECGQSQDPEDVNGGRRCDDDHRLRFLRNDPDESRLAREPFRVLVSPHPEQPLAYVTHQGDSDLTLLELEGFENGGDGRPAIVHQANLLEILGASFSFQGGFGLAERPEPGDGDGDGDGDDDDEATAQIGPLIYASMRWIASAQPVRAIAHKPVSGQTCINHNSTVPSQPGAIICEAQLEPVGAPFEVGGLPQVLDPAVSRPILADIAFSRTGNELYVVQSNPGALVRVDTSLGVDGEPLDVPAGQVEICAQPTSLVIYDDGAVEYGLVTCFRSGEVFIVDLASLTVVGLSRAGIGPDTMAVDLAREVVYVANTLDATISVISMAPTNPARFSQVARIGLQEPYVQ
ncbi:hypothetical protein DB30_08117 [Enhygromyxa salina]|uniref:Uncharacterized protein n=1 Tax=Enhygromyxa salina TaxID=215803 RepID=A0A0C2CUU3_9BACT|nr:hypothetical protein DB30_08117 [Enhygromyxa salina]